MNLIFLDTLMVDIQETDLNLTMNNQNIDYTLTKIDINTWQISPKYTVDVAQGTKLIVQFLNPIYSINNHLLSTTYLSISLFALNLNLLSQSVQSLISNIKILILATLGSSLGAAAFLLDPTSFFSFLQILEIYNYMPLYKANLSPAIIDLLNALNVNRLTPNLMSYLIPHKYGVPLSGKLYDFGITTNLFLINAGIYITGILVLITSKIPVYLGCKFCSKRIKDKLQIILNKYHYSYFTRFYVQSFLDLNIFAIIGIYYSKLSNIIQFIDFILSNVVIVSFIQVGQVLGFVLLVRIIRIKNQKVVPDENFIKIWETFFVETKKEVNPNLYYLIFLFRRTILAVVITLIPYPVLQISVSTTFSLIVRIMQLPVYIFYVDIVKSRVLRLYLIFNDLLCALFFTLMSVDIFKGLSLMSSDVEAYCIKIIIAAILSNFLLSIVQIIQKVAYFVRGAWKKLRVQPHNGIETSVESPHRFKTNNTKENNKD